MSDDAVDYLQNCVVSGRIARGDLLHGFGGNRARMSEVMNKKRALSIEQIRRLHFDVGLDASALLRPIRWSK